MRAATRFQHERIEQRLALDRSLTLPKYQWLLSRFASFYQPVEARLAEFNGWVEWGMEFRAPRHADLLQRDLARLGIAVESPLAAANHPDLRTLSRAVGCRYVLEGATLGGQVVARLVKSKLNLDAKSGAAFFHGRGERTRADWTEFCLGLSRFASAERASSIVAGACDAFDCLDRHLGDPFVQLAPSSETPTAEEPPPVGLMVTERNAHVAG